MIKLVAITLPENKPEHLRLVRAIDLNAPVDAVIGWRVLLRGPAVLLLSPAGKAHEFARTACVLSWGESVDPSEYDKLQTYTSEPLHRGPKPVEAMTDAELDKATAPGGKGAK